MTVVGPVCHIPPETTVTDQPGPQTLPSIPVAQPNIQSLQNTINRMREVLNYITGRQGPRGAMGEPGRPGQPGKPAEKSKPARWAETARQKTTVRIYQNNDKTSQNWVDVERITGLTMTDSVTGEKWSWDRERR